MTDTIEPLRVDHATVVRDPEYKQAPSGLAAEEGTCPHCGEPVEKDEPLSLIGLTAEQDVEGNRMIDLSGTLWVCQKGAAA